MLCVTCGTANEPGAKFCENCGARLGVACASCGSALRENARFCAECGTPVPQASGAAQPTPARPPNSAGPPAAPIGPPPEPTTERRLVTVLFADLVGFTPFSEERDAEEVRETLSRYFDLAKDIVGRYGGTIEKFIGDAVMAVWGTPTAREDDAERAVRAALDLVAAVPGIDAKLHARAGLLTGEAVVTLGATDQGMVAGDLVNTASRLQGVAAPGTVLVGETTHRTASMAITFESAGEQLLKGKSAPVLAWRALRVVAERGGRNRSEALEAPFVGREAELRLLKDLYHSTSRERRARLISISGVAGIGKSRLAWEFEKYLDGLVETVRWHAGRSPAYGEGVTFWALGEMVRSRAGLIEADDHATTREKVAASVREWVPDESEQPWIESALLALLGAGDPPPGGRDALFAAWRTYFERMAASDIVTMIFQDLHWADAGMLDFIDHVMEWSRDLPIFIVTHARPELLERRPDWGAGKRNFTAIGLEPLPAASMHELLAGLVPGLPPKTANAIVNRADGIPLYAVEMVRTLVADGRLVESDGTYQPVGDLGDVAVPETLHALIAARLDSLEPADKALLQDAAVVGQSFTPAGLGSVMGVPPDELEPRLRALVRKEVLTHKGDPRSPERGQYSFVQALFRDVAYSMLAKPERKVRHLAAARWFESLGEEELAGALAAHYLAAYLNAPAGAEADALAAQARIALRAAGDRAAELGSHEQAMTFYDQALTVSPNEVERIELLLRAAEAASLAGHHDEADERAGRALEIERAGGDRTAIAHATALLGRVRLNGYRTDTALAVLEPAYTQLAGVAELADEPAIIALGGQLARAYFFADQNKRAIEVANGVLEAAEHANLISIIADTLVTKGSALCNVGRSYEGTTMVRAGQELAEKHALSETLFRALANRVGFAITFDPREAYEIARSGINLGRRMGWRNPTLVTNFAAAAMRVGDWDTALDETRRLLERLEVDGVDWLQTAGITYVITTLRGQPDEQLWARLDAARHQPLDNNLRMTILEGDAWRALATRDYVAAYDYWLTFASVSALNAPDSLVMAGRVATWTGDVARLKQAAELLDATGIHGPTLDLLRRPMRAAILGLEGRPAEALPEYRDVLQRLREMDLPLDEAFLGIDMLSVLGPAEAEARSAGQRARELLERFEATPLVAILDGVAAASTTGDPPVRDKQGGAGSELVAEAGSVPAG
ncbi:adenylate/guanylate cyclase domain-containing protein [soil metagenome]